MNTIIKIWEHDGYRIKHEGRACYGIYNGEFCITTEPNLEKALRWIDRRNQERKEAEIYLAENPTEPEWLPEFQ